MSNRYLKVIPYVKCDIDFGVPVLAVLGLIYSKWAFDYFLVSIFGARYYYWRRNECMINEIKLTHDILAAITVYLLYLGFKDANKKYIRLWYNFKVIESVCLLIGTCIESVCLLIGTCRVSTFDLLFVFVALHILGYGCYVIKNVQRGFNELPNEETDSISSQVNQKLDNLDAENEEPPPPYSETNVNNDEMKIPIDRNEIPMIHK